MKFLLDFQNRLEESMALFQKILQVC
jgi:hypothetical protein